jgi:hypothetical protein
MISIKLDHNAIIDAIKELPPEKLPEVAQFIADLRYKARLKEGKFPPYHPVQLGGIWRSGKISDCDIKDVRREMWRNM